MDSKKAQKKNETQDNSLTLIQVTEYSDKEAAKVSGGRQPIEECGCTGL